MRIHMRCYSWYKPRIMLWFGYLVSYKIPYVKGLILRVGVGVRCRSFRRLVLLGWPYIIESMYSKGLRELVSSLFFGLRCDQLLPHLLSPWCIHICPHRMLSQWAVWSWTLTFPSCELNKPFLFISYLTQVFYYSNTNLNNTGPNICAQQMCVKWIKTNIYHRVNQILDIEIENEPYSHHFLLSLA